MADSKIRLAQMVSKLREKSYRITPQRLAVLKILAGSEGHPSVEKIYGKVKRDFSTTSLATVYKTLIDVGVLELNRNSENYFAEVEQAAFNPANIVPGIGFSPDKMLQGRLFSYGDAQRYRLGVNHHLIPVNSMSFYNLTV